MSIKKPTILVVDDDELIRELFVVYLSDYTCLTAANGLEALKIYKEQSIDVVILDIIMPGMTGDKVLIELQKINSNVKVIVCSGYTPENLRTKINNLGCEILEKPIDFNLLNKKILMLL